MYLCGEKGTSTYILTYLMCVGQVDKYFRGTRAGENSRAGKRTRKRKRQEWS